jgi:hypothetical protein
MSEGLMKRFAEAFRAGARFEFGAAVGNRHEVIGPAWHARFLEAASKIGGHRVGLDRRPRLAGQEIQRRPRRCGRREHRSGIGGIEHVKTRPARGDAEYATKCLGGQTRTAHAEQHDVAEAVALDVIRELEQPRDRVGHHGGDVIHPSRFAIFLLDGRIGAPHRRLSPPDAAAARSALSEAACNASPIRPGERRRLSCSRTRLADTSSISVE